VALIGGTEQACNEIGVLLEVDMIYRRIRRKAGTVEDQERELLAEWHLPAPGRTSSNDAPVDENERLHGRIVPL
jgi:hypothetical protein